MVFKNWNSQRTQKEASYWFLLIESKVFKVEQPFLRFLPD